jgi:hypothetical protein
MPATVRSVVRSRAGAHQEATIRGLSGGLPADGMPWPPAFHFIFFARVRQNPGDSDTEGSRPCAAPQALFPCVLAVEQRHQRMHFIAEFGEQVIQRRDADQRAVH